MAGNSLSSISNALKVLYKSGAPQNLVYEDHPLLGMLPKFTGVKGSQYQVPIMFGHGQSSSRDFSTAQTSAAAGGISYEKWEVDMKNYYHIATITGEALDAAEGKPESFLQGQKDLVDSAFGNLADRLETFLFRDGSGVIGTLDTYTSGDTLTLTSSVDCMNFEVGQRIQCAANWHSAPDSTIATVSAVDPIAKTVTIGSGEGSGITATTGYVLFNVGDAPSASAYNIIYGLEGWIPVTASATAFMGVVRTAHPRLAGVRVDCSTGYGSEVEKIITSQAAGSCCNGRPNVLVCSPTQFGKIAKELESKAQYNKVLANGSKGQIATIGYRSIQIEGMNGVIDVVQSYACPDSVEWLLQMNTWELASRGNCPKLIEYHDGLVLRALGAEDGAEIRSGFRAQLLCKAPGKNVRIKLA